MKKYMLTKGTVSKIRTDKAGVEELAAAGFSRVGEVEERDGAYVVVSPVMEFADDAAEKARKARESLVAAAVKKGIGTAEQVAAMTDDAIKAALKALGK